MPKAEGRSPESSPALPGSGGETDPGPGEVRVLVTDSSKVFRLNKRAAASKSEYFKVNLSSWHERDDFETLKLDPEFCSAEAMTVLEEYINFGDLDYSSPEQAEEVMKAANYLLMPEAEKHSVERVMRLISKQNFVNYYQTYCVTRGIIRLQNFIMSTIVRPSNSARRRKYGKFDMTIKLSHLEFPCHQSLMSAASRRIQNILTSPDQSLHPIVEGGELGISSQNAQVAFNFLEWIYLNQQLPPVTSMADCLTVLRLAQRLLLSERQIQPVLQYLSHHVSLTNVSQILQVGVDVGLEEVRRIALLYLIYKISDLEPLFLSLSLQDVCTVLSDSRLNVQDELTVAQLAFKWVAKQNKSITEFEDVFRHIRWSLLSRAQVESFLSSPEYDHLQEVLQEVAAEPGLHEPRGWPQELLLVSSNGAALTFQFYNFKRKSWRTEAGPRLGEGCGVAGLVEEGHSLVVTQTNPEGSSTPVSVSQYNLWTQQWTIPATTQRTPVKVSQSKVKSAVCPLTGTVFSAVRSSSPGTALWGAQLTGASPVYSYYGLAHSQDSGETPGLVITGTTVNIITRSTVWSYNTRRHTWSQSSLPGSVTDSSWLTLSDQRLVRTGGLASESHLPTAECSVFGGLQARPVSLGSLSEGREGHHMTEYRGSIFLAGGRTLPRRRNSSEKEGQERSVVEYYVPQTDVWHPLPAQPSLSPLSTVLAILVVNTPLRSLNLSPARGVKRGSGWQSSSEKKSKSD